MTPGLRRLGSRALWAAVRALHRADFALLLPAIARLPVPLGHRLAAWRGRLNAITGRDWRSVALGFRHIRKQSALGYRELPGNPGEARIRAWTRERFVVEARDEYEARLVAAGRVPELACEVVPAGALEKLKQRKRGLVLLTGHFESSILGLAFLARCGAKVNVMSSAVTHDPRVDAAVQRHFTAKYRGLEQFLNGGQIVDFEQGTREFYRMLQKKEVLAILGDAPAVPGSATMEVEFLGATRVLSGGPLRLAQRTDSDLGCFVCRHLGGRNYRLELGPIGPASDPATVAGVYRFFSLAILGNPGGWWAADLLPNMPIVAEAPARGAAAASDVVAAASDVVAAVSDVVAAASDVVAAASDAVAAASDVVIADLIRNPWMPEPAPDLIRGQARHDKKVGVPRESRQRSPAPVAHALVLTDSPLAGSQELVLGLRQLRVELRDAPDRWHEAPAAQVPPAGFLAQCTASQLLVLLQPALLVAQSLPAELQACLSLGGADCAVAADQRGQHGEWAIGYTTQADFERYVAKRQSLPLQARWEGSPPWAYLVQVAAARELLQREPALGWHDLPGAFAAAGRTVMAPRAFVHSYGDYQQGAREEMLGLLPPQVQRLLDVGGGEGHFARAFIEQRCGEAWLVEPSAAAGKAQPHEKLNVFQGRLEDLGPQQAGHFDAVSFLDVLEHMDEPLDALMSARRFLHPGGLLLVSVPNVGHWSVVRDLALGRFDYLPVGILCGTHRRFFTARSLERLLGEAGFEVVRWRRAGPPLPEEFGRFLAATAQAQLAWDTESLRTESLHVLAALR